MTLHSSQHSTVVPHFAVIDTNFAMVVVTLGGVLVVIVICVTAIIAIVYNRQMRAESKDIVLDVGDVNAWMTPARKQTSPDVNTPKRKTRRKPNQNGPKGQPVSPASQDEDKLRDENEG